MNITSEQEYKQERLFSLQEDYSYIIEYKNELTDDELNVLIEKYNCEVEKYNDKFMTNLTFLHV